MDASRHLARRDECVGDIGETGRYRVSVEIPVAPGHLASCESGARVRRIGACRVGRRAGEGGKNVTGTVCKCRRPIKGIELLREAAGRIVGRRYRRPANLEVVIAVEAEDSAGLALRRDIHRSHRRAVTSRDCLRSVIGDEGDQVVIVGAVAGAGDR